MILHKIYAYLKQGGKHDKFGNFYAESTPLHEKALGIPIKETVMLIPGSIMKRKITNWR